MALPVLGRPLLHSTSEGQLSHTSCGLQMLVFFLTEVDFMQLLVCLLTSGTASHCCVQDIKILEFDREKFVIRAEG